MSFQLLEIQFIQLWERKKYRKRVAIKEVIRKRGSSLGTNPILIFAYPSPCQRSSFSFSSSNFRPEIGSSTKKHKSH